MNRQLYLRRKEHDMSKNALVKGRNRMTREEVANLNNNPQLLNKLSTIYP